MIKATAVSELKASLSEYLKRVKSGDEIIVTERGKPVARIVPFKLSSSAPEDLRHMEKEGLIAIGEGRLPKDFWNLPRPKDDKGSVLKALIEEREEGR